MSESKAPTVIRRGCRVETSGLGRTAHWPRMQATVTRVRRYSVMVVWDGTHFEDEMARAEVRTPVLQNTVAGE